MLPHTTDTALDDIEFLARSPHRVTVLESLAERPQSRAALRTETGASMSTVGRTLREFEARHWIVRDGDEYRATQLGSFVAAGLSDLLERIETERTLRDVWEWLPIEANEFPIEIGADAVVTVAETSDPYRPVNRFVELLRETETFRFLGFDLGLLDPCREEFCQRILDGMETEIIDPPHVAAAVRRTHPDLSREALESGNLTVLLHREVPPYGISLFEHRVGISGYNQDSGTVKVFVDTETPAARRWAEDTYEQFRREARPLATGPELE
ncbi:helix-turn-helix transcriptional regulator [Natrialba sp. SSL1]|uniref:helix-turn-helix transcriptional regulator n=1 Tax=Natrialba sp. SSL1 TaxID=1869245 RepID=UPI0008F922AF|nr:MarR family transcriptional regulator [Natrialba sp. SSL1]OIB58225.1 DNA-binding protein [Natrialba sp. SSL1]